MHQFQRRRLRYFWHRGRRMTRCVVLLVICVTVYRLSYHWSPGDVTLRDTTRLSPPDDVDMFAMHFQAGFRFHADSSHTQIEADEEKATYPRLPDDWPQFFLPRSQPQFSLHRFPYRHEASGTCNTSLDLLVLVLSAPSHRQRRQAIRDTWGGVARGRAWPGRREGPEGRVRLVFLLGEGRQGEEVSQAVRRESQEHGDLLQWQGLHDSYFNLTWKVLLGLRWVSQRCRQAAHVLKADDDTFVHVPRVLRRLLSFSWTDGISGVFFQSSPCSRSGKYAVSRDAYPFDMYPPHVKGNLYILPGHLVPRLVMLAPYLPYNNMEDVHVTGTLARALGVRHEPFAQREFSAVPRSPDPCVFMDEVTLGSQQVAPSLAYRIWASFSDSQLCVSQPSITV